MGQTICEEIAERPLGPHIDGDIFQRVILRARDAHRAVQVRETRFEIVAAAHQEGFRVHQLDPNEIQIQLRFQLLAIERFDLTGDEAAFPDRFFRDADESLPFQAVQVASLHVDDHQCPPRVHVLLLRAFPVLRGLHQVPGEPEIVDALAREDAGRVGAQVGLEQPSGRRNEPGIDASRAGSAVRVGIDLRIVERLRLFRSRG